MKINMRKEERRSSEIRKLVKTVLFRKIRASFDEDG